MELFVRHSYTRQGRKENHLPDFMALTTSEREYFMQGVAAYMVANGLPNQIHISPLNQLIVDLIAGAPPSISAADALSGEVLRPLRERIANSEYGIEHVQTDVRACGLLVDDPAAPGTFRFGHKSFMEYIFAAVVADRVVKDSTISRTLLRIVNGRIGDILQLPVAVEFLSELVETKGMFLVPPSPKDYEKAFAQQLLSATLDHSGLMYLGERCMLFGAAYQRTTRKLPVVTRITILLLPALVATVLIASVLSHAFQIMAIRPATARLSSGHAVTLQEELMVMVASMTVLMIMVSIMRLGYAHHPGYALWNLLCKRLSIHDRVLHRIAGTYWLPWARHQAFDYFLADIDSIGETRPQVPRPPKLA
jgi:hypothetical protein